ncbi:MAG: hypothetical protein KAQ98_13240 [Bacteriovoracaceae bacterium]|nr:hypothetical protein [Bacteriovoracaceae bacterium]
MEKKRKSIGEHDLFFESITTIFEIIIKGIFHGGLGLITLGFDKAKRRKGKDDEFSRIKKYYQKGRSV